ncbi:MAG: AI-2E family transporter [Methanomicrobiaceae archaeon]|nr:AI-2E family transporter [Methanomicrobiaceae archaeon]
MSVELTRIDVLTFVLIGAIIVATILAFWPLLSVIILAMSMAIVMLPFHRLLCTRLPSSVSAALSTILIGVFLFGSLAYMFTIIYQNSDYLTQIVGSIIASVQSLQVDFIELPVAIPREQVAEWLRDQIGNFSDYISGIIKGIPFLIIQLIIFFLTLYIAILKGDDIWSQVMDHLPDRIRDSISKMTEMVVNTLYAIYVVHIATSVLTFILAIPFFYFLGFGHVIFYSLMAAIFQLIPIIGPSFLMVFIAIYSISIGDYRSTAAVALIGYPVVCAFPDIYLRPTMMGKRASIHPVLMWIGFFGGLAVMGIVGFVLGPLFIALVVSGYAILIEELKQAKTSEEEKGKTSS